MKKFGIALAAAALALPAFTTQVMAGEEIKLAAALGSGGTETAAEAGSAGASTAASTSAAATANMVAIGFIAASGLAIAADIDSSDSH